MQFDTIHAVPAICWQPGTITVLAQKIWLHVMSVLQNYQNSVYFFLSVNPFRGTVPLICGSLQGWVRTISWPDKWSMNWMQWFFLWSKYVLLFAIEKLQHDTFDKYFNFSHQFFSFLFFFVPKVLSMVTTPFHSSLCFTQYCVVCLSAFINHRRGGSEDAAEWS